MKPQRDDSPLPNPDPKTFHGVWTDWSDEHDQKSLKKDGTYFLHLEAKVPKGGKDFMVKQTHPWDGGSPTFTQSLGEAKVFSGYYLLSTCWNWERQFKAVTP